MSSAERLGEDILPEAIEQRLFTGRYLVKCPLSLERLRVADDESVIYAAKEPDNGSDPESKTFSPLEFLAELSQHIPNTYEQLIRYYGYYSARSRGLTLRPFVKGALGHKFVGGKGSLKNYRISQIMKP